MPPTQKPADRQFTFILVSDENDTTSQKTVRAHAMRESIRQRRAGIESSIPSHLPPIPYSTGRFRLASSSTKSKPSGKSKGKATKQTEAATSEKVPQDESNDFDPSSLSTQTKRPASLTLPPVPSAGLLEPFNAMPVKLALKQQKLMYFYGNSYVQNAWAFNSKTRMFSPASHDPAWLHAMFAVVAVNHDLRMGNNKILSQEALFHRGEAMHVIQNRLKASLMNVSESTLGAVAALANHESLNGSFLGASTHINGLEQMLNARGGIRNLSNNAHLLRKIVTLADLVFAQTWGVAPRLPLLEDLNLQPAEHTDNEVRLPQGQNGSDFLEPYICTALQKVRILSEIMDDLDPSEAQRVYFSRNLYHLNHQLATITRAPDANGAPVDSESLKANTKRIAILIYISIALRQVPHNAAMNYVAARNLKICLERGGLPAITESNKQLVLWMLFVGGAATCGRFEKSYFVQNLASTATVMELSSLEEFRAVLRSVAWTNAFGRLESASLWKEIIILHGEVELSEDKQAYSLPGQMQKSSGASMSSTSQSSVSLDLQGII